MRDGSAAVLQAGDQISALKASSTPTSTVLADRADPQPRVVGGNFGPLSVSTCFIPNVVHLSLRFLASLRRLESKGHADSASTDYKLGIPSSRNVTTKSESSSQEYRPQACPSYGLFSSQRSRSYRFNNCISSGPTLWRLRTESSCSRPLRRETNSFSPSFVGKPSRYPKTLRSSQTCV